MKKNFALLLLSIFSLPAFAQSIVVSGNVKNYTDSNVIFLAPYTNALTGQGDDKRYKAAINKNGEFKIALPVKRIAQWLIEYGDDDNIFFHLIPDSNVRLLINPRDTGNEVKAFGEHADDFNYFNFFLKNALPYLRSQDEKKSTADAKGALNLRIETSNFEISMLNRYRKTHNMSEGYYNWLKTFYKYEPYERTYVEDIIPGKSVSDSGVFILLTKNDVNNDYAATNSNEYNELVEYYTLYKFNGFKFPFKSADLFEFGINNLSGLTKQVFLTRKLIGLSRTPNDSLYQSIYIKYIKEVDDKTLLSLAETARKNYLADVAISKSPKENVSQNASLNEIFSKYKGKVIYVDFWASWCGPCRGEMPNSDKLNSKLKNSDVVFLYLGYQDKKEDWLSARKEIGIRGEHYLLSSQLIKDANDVFEVTGIPHYAIIDKDGTIIDKNAGRPGMVYSQLLKLAEAK